MKRIILSIALLLSLGITAWAQTPQQFNYQGIARSATGTPLASTTLSLRLTVHEGSSTGTVDYQETQITTTNTFGLYNLAIGSGTTTGMAGAAATLGAVTWGAGLKFLEVEIDPEGATNFISTGTAQLLSVPYALYAGNSPATGVTSVATGAGLTGGPITTTGTISMPNEGTPGTYGSGTTVPVITTDAQGRVTAVTNTPIVSGAGTVTSVSAGTGLSGGPITTSGSLSLGTAGTAGVYGSGTQVPVFTTDAYGRVIAVTNTPITVAGSGTVTSVTAGPGLTGGTITTAGTVSMPTVGTAGTYGSATGIPEITTDIYGRVTAVTVNPVAASITSTGTVNYIAKFTSPTAIANSGMYNVPGGQVGLGTLTPIATFDAESASDTMAGFFASSVFVPSTVNGVLTSEYQGFEDAGIALQGNANNDITGNGTIGVQGIGTALGMQAIGASQQVSGFASVRGVEGDGMGDDQYAMGVGAYGTPDVGAPLTSYGIVANATGGATNYSGYFIGDVFVGGTLSKAGGTFKIDNPLDPANKYLEHSFVESPDMMNIYNGNITTDASGTATVSLPEYFEILNKDFRYQLTVIGSFAQAMVSKEVSGNKFEIKTSVPNVKVSWQVTGIRQDAWANAHRVVPEREKESFNKGKYLDAKDFGKPESDQIGDNIAHPSPRAKQMAGKTTAKKKDQK